MTRVSVDEIIPASIEDVWAVAGNFGGLADWVPPIVSSALASGATGGEVGDMREIVLDGGPTFIETQTARSDDDRTYSYSIPDGVLPVKGYEGTIALRADGEATVVEWSSTFETDPGAEQEVSAMINGVYEAGLDQLRRHFGG